MREKTIVTVGSSVVDIFIKSSEFRLKSASDGVLLCQSYGDKVEVDSFQVLTGGGGSNTAVGFSRLGFNVELVSETGKDTLAELIVNDLKKANVGLDYLVQEKKEQTGGSVILLGPDGGRTVMVHRGAASLLDPEDLPKTAIVEASWLHLSSLSGRKNTLLALFKLRQMSKKLSFNPGKKELELLVKGELKEVLSAVEILLLNRQEWQILAQVQEHLLKSVPIVVVTNGSQGGEVFVSGDTKTFQAQSTQVVDATGAGDAFGVGFVTSIIWGLGVDKAIEFGVKNSASVVAQFGAKPGLLKKSQLLSP